MSNKKSLLQDSLQELENIKNESLELAKEQLINESADLLEKKSADKEHPFLSEDAEYYELRVNTSTDENIENWLSVFNLVGIDGTEITLQGLIANGNLV